MMSPRLAKAFPIDIPISHVWSGGELDGRNEACKPSGHGTLDEQLPGGGWPEGGLLELMQAEPEEHVWRLLLPALAQAVQAHAGPVVLVDPPREPFGPSLRAQGLPAERLLMIHAGKPAARLWATEQALRCGEVAAVLSWLPQAKNDQLRRLHMASVQQGRLFFAFRPLHVKNDSSPARLRLLLEGTDVMKVHVLKRRGPPLVSPVLLPAQAGRLADLLRARKGTQGARGQPVQSPPSIPAGIATPEGSIHALDRLTLPG